MPVSITATTTWSLPVVSAQAAGAPMSAPGVPPVWPVFRKAHCSPNRGSSGSASAWTT